MAAVVADLTTKETTMTRETMIAEELRHERGECRCFDQSGRLRPGCFYGVCMDDAPVELRQMSLLGVFGEAIAS